MYSTGFERKEHWEDIRVRTCRSKIFAIKGCWAKLRHVDQVTTHHRVPCTTASQIELVQCPLQSFLKQTDIQTGMSLTIDWIDLAVFESLKAWLNFLPLSNSWPKFGSIGILPRKFNSYFFARTSPPPKKWISPFIFPRKNLIAWCKFLHRLFKIQTTIRL